MKHSNHTQGITQVGVKVSPVDIAAARQYLAGIEALAREGRKTRDPRVIRDALAVLERQHVTVGKLRRGKAVF